LCTKSARITPYFVMLLYGNDERKMINVHHMYNKGTTPLSHGV